MEKPGTIDQTVPGFPRKRGKKMKKKNFDYAYIITAEY